MPKGKLRTILRPEEIDEYEAIVGYPMPEWVTLNAVRRRMLKLESDIEMNEILIRRLQREDKESIIKAWKKDVREYKIILARVKRLYWKIRKRTVIG